MDNTNEIEELKRRVAILETALYTVLDYITYDNDETYCGMYKLVTGADGVDKIVEMKQSITRTTEYLKE